MARQSFQTLLNMKFLIIIIFFLLFSVKANAFFIEEPEFREYLNDDEFFDHDLGRAAMEEMRNEIEADRMDP